jgi:hypothetical protein
VWSGPQGRGDLIANEDPSATEPVRRDQSSTGVLEHRRRREVEKLGDLAAIEHVITRELRERRVHALGS